MLASVILVRVASVIGVAVQFDDSALNMRLGPGGIECGSPTFLSGVPSVLIFSSGTRTERVVEGEFSHDSQELPS